MTRHAGDAGDSILTRQTQWDSSWPGWLNPDERGKILEYWEGRFHINGKVFSPYDFCATSRKIYLVRHNEKMPLLNRLKIQQAGLPFMRRVAGYLKPTTEAAQRFGIAAKKNVAELQGDELKRLCVAEEVKGAWPDMDEGYVFLKAESWIWGCGLFLEPGRLICQLPKSMKRWLAGKSPPPL